MRPFPLAWCLRWLEFWARIQFRKARRASARGRRSGGGIQPAGHHPPLDHFRYRLLRRYLAYLLFLKRPRDGASLVSIDGWSRVEASLREGRGAVLLSTHVGLPRVFRWFLGSVEEPTLHIVGKDAGCHYYRFNPAQWLWRRFRLDAENVIGLSDFRPSCLKQGYDHLRSNGLVHIAGDGSGGVGRLEVEVLGRRHHLAAGGLSLGRLSGAPIFPCFTILEQGLHIRLEVQEPLECPEGLPDSEQLASLARSYAARIEKYLVDNPSASNRTYRRNAAP